MQVKAAVSLAVLVCMVLIIPLHGEGIETDEGKRIRREEPFERTLTGLVEKIPDKVFGIWRVKGEDVLVTKDTYIQEEQGLLEPGALVEIKGRFINDVFTARKVQVKAGKRQE